MSEREFERRTGPRFTFGDRRGPATPYPGIVDGSSDFGAGSLLAEHRGSLADAEADAVHRWIAPAVAGKHVLDVGCGAGHGAEILRDAGAETVVGTDPDPREIEVATRQYGHEAGLRFVTAPPAALPLASGSFDVVLCAETLDSVALETALPELRRVLKADGLLVVSLPLDRSAGRDRRQRAAPGDRRGAVAGDWNRSVREPQGHAPLRLPRGEHPRPRRRGGLDSAAVQLARMPSRPRTTRCSSRPPTPSCPTCRRPHR